MTITYDVTENRITVSGGDTTTPLSFEDIYNEDIANGWGVFIKIADNVYQTKAKITFTNCVFRENDAVLIMDNLGTSLYDRIMYFTTGADCGFTSVSFWNNETGYVCGYRIDSDAKVYFIGCAFYHNVNGKKIMFTGTGSKCVFERCYSELYHWILEADFIDCIIGGEYGYISRPPEGCIFDNLQIQTKYDHCFWLTSGDYIVSGGKYNAADELAVLNNTNSFIIKNANLLRNNIAIDNDAGVVSNFVIAYDVVFKILDTNGNLVMKKLRITDALGNVVYDDYATEEVIELPLFSFEFTGDGSIHHFTEDDYTCHTPYTVEVYDELKTYHRGTISELGNNNRIYEIVIDENIPDIFVEIENLRKEVLKNQILLMKTQ